MVSVCEYACVSEVARGGRKRVLDSLGLELQAVVSLLTWLLRTNLGSLQEQCVCALVTAEPSSQALDGVNYMSVRIFLCRL